MTHPSFPVELIRSLFSYVSDTRTILSLLYVCRHIHDEAERLLYNDLFLSDLGTGRRRRLLMMRLRDTPRLAQHVRFLSLRLTPDSALLPSSPLTAPIHLMMNLVELDVMIFGPGLPATEIMRNCQAQLRHLYFWTDGALNLTAFLERQPQLLSLALSTGDGTVPLPQPSALPNLRFLAANHTRIIRGLMSGRNIIGLKWTQPEHHEDRLRTNDITPSWQLAVGNLRVLDISTFQDPSIDIMVMVPYLTKVMILFTSQRDAISGDLLAALPALRIVSLSFSVSWSDPERKKIVEDIFAKNPGLIFVENVSWYGHGRFKGGLEEVYGNPTSCLTGPTSDVGRVWILMLRTP
ncbi:hypothetical protein HGRIS_002747 [Hohenbuehelia grisea]|uniref:F-box domain-containing protein n=1 Tax=Hohenbuehelia grisea TaxID=104357 RepID=A0ABR3JLK1_9AGAR